jgi:hypothetical protein
MTFANTPGPKVQHLRLLRHEVRKLAREQVEALARDFNSLGVFAAEIAGGGSAYPAGLRQLASMIAADLPPKVRGLMAILDRAQPVVTGPRFDSASANSERF